MGKGGKKNPKGKKTVSVKDLPAKPKGGAAIKGGWIGQGADKRSGA